MKLIKPQWEIWEQEPGIQGIYKAIERAGRICYLSNDKITEDSAKPFVERMVSAGHHAMLEHGTVYLMCYFGDKEEFDKNKVLYHHRKPSYEEAMDYLLTNEDEDAWYAEEPDYIASKLFIKYQNNKYSKVVPFLISKKVYPKGVLMSPDGNGGISLRKPNSQEPSTSSLGGICITTNYRVLVENNWLDDLKYLCEPTEYHEKRVTVHFVLPIGISREFCRHRVFSFAEQSTRYCNFSADKFNNELTFIEDQWCDEELLRQIEHWYINSYLKPQEKRNMLPLCTKTELVMTGFVSDWKHFFFLRCPINAHPQARELAIPLSEEFVKRELIIK